MCATCKSLQAKRRCMSWQDVDGASIPIVRGGKRIVPSSVKQETCPLASSVTVPPPPFLSEPRDEIDEKTSVAPEIKCRQILSAFSDDYEFNQSEIYKSCTNSQVERLLCLMPKYKIRAMARQNKLYCAPNEKKSDSASRILIKAHLAQVQRKYEESGDDEGARNLQEGLKQFTCPYTNQFMVLPVSFVCERRGACPLGSRVLADASAPCAPVDAQVCTQTLVESKKFLAIHGYVGKCSCDDMDE